MGGTYCRRGESPRSPAANVAASAAVRVRVLRGSGSSRIKSLATALSSTRSSMGVRCCADRGHRRAAVADEKNDCGVWPPHPSVPAAAETGGGASASALLMRKPGQKLEKKAAARTSGEKPCITGGSIMASTWPAGADRISSVRTSSAAAGTSVTGPLAQPRPRH